MQIITGDLFAPEHDFEAIGHGVNCYGKMAAGIAKTFRSLYPSMYMKYSVLCEDGLLEPGGMFQWYSHKDERWIYNIASQDKPGPDATVERLHRGLVKTRDHMVHVGITTLGLPLIGAGIGGLTEQQTLDTISTVFDPTGLDVTVVKWG